MLADTNAIAFRLKQSTNCEYPNSVLVDTDATQNRILCVLIIVVDFVFYSELFSDSFQKRFELFVLVQKQFLTY